MLTATSPVAGDVSPRPRQRLHGALVLEALLVVASPVLLFFVLRMRAMAPLGMPDPVLHTAYILHPQDFFRRYSTELAPIAGLREGARVGFLEPARISYLLFGAVPGFFVLRYVLALVAVVPSYVLFRRLYGRAGGALVVVLILSSPVLITAWGTDYPDSAVVSYLIAGLACLAMPCGDRRRPYWRATASVFLTLAVWSLFSAAALVAVTLVVYAAVWILRGRRELVRDIVVMAGAAVAAMALLAVGSQLLLGRWDYVLPTAHAFRYLSQPAIQKQYHSSNPAWILLRPYELVPFAVALAWVVVFARRIKSIPTSHLFIGATCLAQLAAFTYLQFAGNVEALELHYYSSNLWSVVTLTLALTATELSKPLLRRPVLQYLPAGVALVIPLAYELDPHVPGFGWLPIGVFLVGAIAVAAGIARLAGARRASGRGLAGAGVIVAIGLVAVLGISLVLTVAPYEHHAHMRGVKYFPTPAYATALGGSASALIDQYRVGSELPGFVGNATYPGELLMMWLPERQLGYLRPLIGLYHAPFNHLSGSPPHLDAKANLVLSLRRPAEILVLNTPDFPETLRAFASWDPQLLRSGVLRSGNYAVHVWLIALRANMPVGTSP